MKNLRRAFCCSFALAAALFTVGCEQSTPEPSAPPKLPANTAKAPVSDMKPAESKPEEKKADEKKAEAKPADAKPAETKPEEKKADAKPADGKPALEAPNSK